MMSNCEIKCENLKHSFSGKTIFQGLSFQLSSGESLAVTGSNGSGKSTLLKVISNILSPHSGKISMFDGGEEIPRERFFTLLGMSAPYINLYDELTGYENMEFFLDLNNISSPDRSRLNKEEEISKLLKQIGIYENRNKTVKNYSSGMKQRLRLAFSIINDPPVLLMDEPGTNLDSMGIEIVRRIAEKQKEKGILIIATNDKEDLALCDRQLNIEEYK